MLRKLEIENINMGKRLFVKGKEFVENCIVDFNKNLPMDFEYDLKVCFENSKNPKDIASFTFRRGKNYLFIYQTFVKRVLDGDYECYPIIYHELCHLYDNFHIRNCQYTKFDPSKSSDDTARNMLLDIGYRAWTEFYAYLKQLKVNEYKYAYPTTKQMVEWYKKIVLINKKIMNLSKSREMKKTACELKQEIEKFSYFCSMYLAGSISGKRRYYTYASKTTNSKEYKWFEKFSCGLIKRFAKMFTGTYGKYLERRLYNIGVYIFKELYIPFGIHLQRIDRKWHLVKVFDKED